MNSRDENGIKMEQHGDEKNNIIVKRYEVADYERWNVYVKEAKNGLFMFDRNYMDYHKERFTDHSLLFMKGDSIAALMPANEEKGILISHGGLTYGGLILNEKAKQHTVNGCFDAMLSYLERCGIEKLRYKTIPHIYHKQPSEEDKYALYRNGARLSEVSASTVINLKASIKISKGRKSQVSRAKREGVVIQKLECKQHYEMFMNLENSTLESRHNVRAVHSAEELYLLHSRFPENIHLYGALLDNNLIAGAVIYEYDQVIHTQYMAADETARTIGGLDLTIASIIDEYKGSKQQLDFGISTERGGKYLNKGLIAQKEGFGGRTNVYELWEMNVEKSNENSIL